MNSAGQHLPLDQRVWEQWVNKNRSSERVYFERRIKIATVLSPLVVATLLAWFLVR